MLFKPSLGEETALRFAGHQHTALAMATGFAIGFYDGALGPGTGSFFVFALVGLLGYSFLEASAKARIANWATNLAALCVFVPQGAVLWKVGLVMGACNLARRVRRCADRRRPRVPVRAGVLHRRRRSGSSSGSAARCSVCGDDYRGGMHWLTAFLDLAPEDFDRSVEFWQGVTGYAVSPPRGPDGEFVSFVPPEGDVHLKAQRIRRGPSKLHLDVHVEDLDAAVDEAEALGAR